MGKVMGGWRTPTDGIAGVRPVGDVDVGDCFSLCKKPLLLLCMP